MLAASVLLERSAAVADFESFVGVQIPEAAAFELVSAAATVDPWVAGPAVKRTVGSLQ